ncbi:Helicase sen1, partial [Globisporangium splendens]
MKSEKNLRQCKCSKTRTHDNKRKAKPCCVCVDMCTFAWFVCMDNSGKTRSSPRSSVRAATAAAAAQQKHADAVAASMSAPPALALKKKAKKRRDERDESEFVSVEVGMREFQRRLANSKNPSAKAKTTASSTTRSNPDAAPPVAATTSATVRVSVDVAPSVATAQPTKRARTAHATTADKRAATTPRAKAAAASLAVESSVSASAASLAAPTSAPRKRAAAGTKAAKPAMPKAQTPIKAKPATRKSKAASASATRKPMLAEIRAEMLRAQHERVEMRIQTLHCANCNTITHAPDAHIADPNAAQYVQSDIARNGSASHAPTNAQAPHPSQQQQQVPPRASAAPVMRAPPTLQSVQVALPVALTNVPIPAERPVPASETDPIKNEFIDDDFDEDLAFMQALDAVEKTLASTKPASIPTSLPRDDPHWSNTLPQPTPPEATQHVAIKKEITEAQHSVPPSFPQAQSAVSEKPEVSMMSADVLREFERLKQENERLRQSNELLQAAAASTLNATGAYSSMPESSPHAMPTLDSEMRQPIHSSDSSLSMHQVQTTQPMQISPPFCETGALSTAEISRVQAQEDDRSRPRFLNLESWLGGNEATTPVNEEPGTFATHSNFPSNENSISTSMDTNVHSHSTAPIQVPGDALKRDSQHSDHATQISNTYQSSEDAGIDMRAASTSSPIQVQSFARLDDAMGSSQRLRRTDETQDEANRNRFDLERNSGESVQNEIDVSQESGVDNDEGMGERGNYDQNGEEESSQVECEAMDEDEMDYEQSQDEPVRISTIDRGNYDQYKRYEEDDPEDDEEEGTEDEEEKKSEYSEDAGTNKSLAAESDRGGSLGDRANSDEGTTIHVDSFAHNREEQHLPTRSPVSDEIVLQQEQCEHDQQMASTDIEHKEDFAQDTDSSQDDEHMWITAEHQNSRERLGVDNLASDEEHDISTPKARLRVQEISSSDSEVLSSDSESESGDEVDGSSNGLEAALQAAASSFSARTNSKPSNASSQQRSVFSLNAAESATEQPKLGDGAIKRKRPRVPDEIVSSGSSSIPEKKKVARAKAPANSISGSKITTSSSSSHKSTLLWPALDEFYEFILDLSPRRIEVTEKHQRYLSRYFRRSLPAKYSSLSEYTNAQIEAIMEELAASVRSSEQFSHQNSSKSLVLTSVSPCGRVGAGQSRSFSASGDQKLNSSEIFMESGFSGTTSNRNDFIVTFQDNYPGRKSSSTDFMSGDLVLLRSPRWKNYELVVYGIVLCNSVVAVGGRTSESGREGRGNSDDNDLICVLIRTQERDHADQKENFSVLTELCLANQRSSNWKWRLEQVHNLTTSAREFQAIKSVAFLSPTIKQSLLEGNMKKASGEAERKQAAASTDTKNRTKQHVSPGLYSELERKYNSSQLDAILGCIGEENHVIIQGPPGTGKTKTILGVLSAILDGAAVGAPKKSKESTRIRVGASLKNDSSSSASKSVAETSIRILVAAPSNAAVDELIVRLLNEGIYDGVKCSFYRPRIVRVGRPESLQQQRPAYERGQPDSSLTDNKKIKKKWRKYAQEVEEILLENLVTKHRKAFPNTKMARQGIVKNAQIVFCTLSGAGSVSMCDFAQEFDAVVIDEAAQAVEASALIPFKFRPNRIILVGDHRQLPATVISKKLIDIGYDRSLFQRFVENGSQVFLLNKQYRMHPDISDFPSTYFYRGKLIQDAKLKDWTTRKYHAHRLFQPFLFYDVLSGQQSQVSGSKSLRNLNEIDFILLLVRELLRKYPEMDWRKKIGIIAPYKQQIYELGSHLSRLERDLDQRLEIEVNTVDGFQGREKEIIIYSCVRTSSGGNRNRNGKLDAFWADERRMNVAITRAKSSLWIIGNSNLLEQSRAWRALIRMAKDRKKYILDTETDLQ